MGKSGVVSFLHVSYTLRPAVSLLQFIYQSATPRLCAFGHITRVIMLSFHEWCLLVPAPLPLPQGLDLYVI